MKRLLTGFCIAGLVTLAGCNSSPSGGRSGATTSRAPEHATAPATTTETRTTEHASGPAKTTETTTERTEAPKTTERTSGYSGSTKKETFTLGGPLNTPMTRLEQGTTKTFKVSIHRGSDFKDDVTLKAESADPKVHVTLEPSVFRGDQAKDVEATVRADDDAKLGKNVIRITGTPQSGAATTLEVDVDVTAKAKNK